MNELKTRMSSILEKEREVASSKQRDLCDDLERAQKMLRCQEDELTRFYEQKQEDLLKRLETMRKESEEKIKKLEEERNKLEDKVFQLEATAEDYRRKSQEQEKSFAPRLREERSLPDLEKIQLEERIRALEGNLGLLSKEYDLQKVTK